LEQPNYFKIAVIICHMGKLPWYFEYFVHSCKYNSSIDFFIISDDRTYNRQLPENVRLILKTLPELSQLATDKLGFSVDIRFPYKLCDFKPAYGLLFYDIVKDYDFWGHGDIDVIFGDIRGFISDDILDHHDLICVRHDYLTGYFQLFRQNDKLNHLFTKSKDYQKVLQSERHFCFDETNFQFDAFGQGKSFTEVPSEIESMMHVVKKMEKENYIRPFFDFFVVEGVPGKLKWTKGNLFFRGKYEIILYHMIHFKKKYSMKRSPKQIPEVFNISKQRIYHKQPMTTAQTH
jgi:hypothetical protein